jgi:hypothetical protein
MTLWPIGARDLGAEVGPLLAGLGGELHAAQAAELRRDLRKLGSAGFDAFLDQDVRLLAHGRSGKAQDLSFWSARGGQLRELLTARDGEQPSFAGSGRADPGRGIGCHGQLVGSDVSDLDALELGADRTLVDGSALQRPLLWRGASVTPASAGFHAPATPSSAYRMPSLRTSG